MLAQNFQTPVALGISDAEFEAHLKLLGMLERGELKHQQYGDPGHDGFNMARVVSEYSCGTVRCIAGWAKFLNPDVALTLTVKQMELYCPFGVGPTDAITDDQAAIALRNYLTHGEPRWAEALAA